MGSNDQFDITRHANGSNAMNPQTPNNAESRSSRSLRSSRYGEPPPSRENIIRDYNAQDAMRARNTRQYSQEALQDFQMREARALERQRQRAEYSNSEKEPYTSTRNAPQSHMTQEQAIQRARELRRKNRDSISMTAQESHDRTIVSQENFEMERARRDVFSNRNSARFSNREVIDGRGSIDSRALNERNELVGYSIDLDDRPDPAIESVANQRSSWSSRADRGSASGGGGRRRSSGRRQNDLNGISDSISGRADYQQQGFLASFPLSAKLLIVLIIILLCVLIYLLFF